MSVTKGLRLPQRAVEGYRMPEGLSGLGEPPLYLALAYWGLALARAFSRDDVVAAFAISPQRATDAMSRLSRCDLAFIRTRVRYRSRCRYLIVEKRGGPVSSRRESVVGCAVRPSDGPLIKGGVHEQRQVFLRSANLAKVGQACDEPDSVGD